MREIRSGENRGTARSRGQWRVNLRDRVIIVDAALCVGSPELPSHSL